MEVEDRLSAVESLRTSLLRFRHFSAFLNKLSK